MEKGGDGGLTLPLLRSCDGAVVRGDWRGGKWLCGMDVRECSVRFSVVGLRRLGRGSYSKNLG